MSRRLQIAQAYEKALFAGDRAAVGRLVPRTCGATGTTPMTA